MNTISVGKTETVISRRYHDVVSRVGVSLVPRMSTTIEGISIDRMCPLVLLIKFLLPRLKSKTYCTVRPYFKWES